MAIILAVFCVVLVSYVVNEVTYESNIEYAVNAGSVNRLKAYYAAKSGVELSLLRIKLYKKIQKQFGKQLGSQAGLLNLIWSFPLSWPPLLPDEATGVDKDNLNDIVKEAKMDASFNATIFDEGSKIDINDLDSPSKSLREITKKQLLQIFEGKMQDDEWARNHQDLRAEELINHLTDWLDADKQSLNGGDERQYYKDISELASIGIESFPPNRMFRTLDEVRLVAGMTDELFELLAPRITVYGAKAINPNTASREVIKSLDPSINDEIVGEVLARRDNPDKGGPFTAPDDFWGFINQRGGRVAKEIQEGVPLIFDAVTNFSIRSIGEYNGSLREIKAIVFDVTGAATAIADRLKKDNPPPTDPNDPNKSAGTSGQKPNSSPGSQNQTPSKGPPRIVYWSEK